MGGRASSRQPKLDNLTHSMLTTKLFYFHFVQIFRFNIQFSIPKYKKYNFLHFLFVNSIVGAG